jgi:hypothetical protein
MKLLLPILFFTLLACVRSQEGGTDSKSNELDLEKSVATQEDEVSNYEQQLIGVWQLEILDNGNNPTGRTVTMDLKENNVLSISGEEGQWKVDEEEKVLTLTNTKRNDNRNVDIVSIEKKEYIKMTWKRF